MDASKLTQKSLQAIQNAQNIALEYGNAELTTLHLCHALLEKDGIVFRILTRAGTDAEGLFHEVNDRIKRLPQVSGGSMGLRELTTYKFLVRGSGQIRK